MAKQTPPSDNQNQTEGQVVRMDKGDPEELQRKEFREQKHEFILRYYDMATKDLDRHLKIGMQTIIVLAGSLTSLGLGFKGNLPIPLAVLINLLLLGWCAINVFNANIWSLRAIAFLANVEAIYFRKDEREYFNMYAGAHPPWHFIDTLGNLFRLIFIFGIITVGAFFYVIIDPTFGGIREEGTFSNKGNSEVHIASQEDIYDERETKASENLRASSCRSWATFILWLVPLNLAAWILWYSAKKYRKCQKRYLEFMENSPGPGMVTDRAAVRPIDLREQLPESQVESGKKIQSWAVGDLTKKIKHSNFLCFIFGVVSILFLIASMIACFYMETVVRWIPALN